MSRFRPHQDQKDAWLKAFPKVRKFLNQCVVCQELGYDPEKIRKKEGRIFQQKLSKFFKPLETNEIGICADCAQRHAVKAAIDQPSAYNY